MEVPAEADRLAAVKENVPQIWAAIASGNFYPSPSPMNCAICPYRSRCPALSESRASAALLNRALATSWWESRPEEAAAIKEEKNE